MSAASTPPGATSAVRIGISDMYVRQEPTSARLVSRGSVGCLNASVFDPCPPTHHHTMTAACPPYRCYDIHLIAATGFNFFIADEFRQHLVDYSVIRLGTALRSIAAVGRSALLPVCICRAMSDAYAAAFLEQCVLCISPCRSSIHPLIGESCDTYSLPAPCSHLCESLKPATSLSSSRVVSRLREGTLRLNPSAR